MAGAQIKGNGRHIGVSDEQCTNKLWYLISCHYIKRFTRKKIITAAPFPPALAMVVLRGVAGGLPSVRSVIRKSVGFVSAIGLVDLA